MMNKSQIPANATRRSKSSSSGASEITVTAKDPPDEDIVDGMETPPLSSSSTSGDLLHLENLAKIHLACLKLDKRKSVYDTVYGVRINPTNRHVMLMGNAEVRFIDDNITFWRNKKLATYPGSEYLYDMIFLKKPRAALKGNITDTDRATYADILHLTNAMYKNYNTREGLHGTRMMKYTDIIKPIIMEEEGGRGGERSPRRRRKSNSKYSGRGSDKVFNGATTGTDYVYWNTPQELIDHLHLLWSSRMAGNTEHDDEIISILEELDEKGLIF